jgi:hypothetical protein
MGWVSSPPYFCAATETVADLANQMAGISFDPGPHRLDFLSKTPVAPPVLPLHVDDPRIAVKAPTWNPGGIQTYRSDPLAHTEVYMDDFCSAVQGNPRRRQRIKSILLHALDQVWHPLSPDNRPFRQEPASKKKFRKGDGSWATWKTTLGWIIDTVASTLSLPAHRIEQMREILDLVPRARRRIATKCGTRSWANFAP